MSLKVVGSQTPVSGGVVPVAEQAREGRAPVAMGGTNGWATWLRAALGLSDAVVIAAALSLAQVVRFGVDDSFDVVGTWAPPYVLMSIGIGAAWWLALSVAGTRDASVLGHGPQELQRIMSGSWRAFSVVAVIGFLVHWQISRGYLLVAFVFGLAALLFTRGVWRLWIHSRRDQGALQANVLIVGASQSVMELAVRFKGGRRAGFRVVGVASVAGHPEDWRDLDPEIVRVGELTDAVAQARAIGAEFIVVAGTEAMSFEASRQLGWALEGSDIGLLVAPSLADVAGPRVKMSPVAGLPLLFVTEPAFTGARYFVKALLDRLGALLLLAIAGIPMIVIAIVVRRTSPGPAIFVQERVGLDMKPFSMLKFRTMVVDAEDHLDGLLDHNEGAGVLFKMREDPRITRVGRVLRRFSIDELPQLLNVVKGDMSLVGPRPPLAREVATWGANVERRQMVKPGLTGLWQISGRSDLSWEESVRLDLYYTENWSLGGDLVIMMRTIYTVLRPSGAY